MPTWPAFAFLPDDPWGKVVLAFLRAAYERSGSLHTLMHYRQMLTDFFTTPPARLPDAYSRDDIEQYIHSPGHAPGRVGRPVGPGSVNNRLSCLSSFYAYAAGYTMADERGAIVPVLSVPSPTMGIRQVKRPRAYRVLSASEVERFLAVIPRDTEQGMKYRALFICYLFTARRSSEILTMRYGDIERVTLMENGKTRDAFQYFFYGKGHKGERDHAELAAPAAAAIFAYLDKSGRLATITPDDAIWTADTTYCGRGGYDPKRPLNASTIWVAAKRYGRAAGIDTRKMNIHAWRHVSAQQRYLLGEDIFSISHTLRHANIGTTHVYLAGLTTDVDKGAKLLENVFGKM